MEHQQAERQKMALRYMGGELTTVEREEFEWHYFECAECASKVRAMVAAPAAREPGREVRARHGWLSAFLAWRPSPALAMTCVALVVVSYEAVRERGRLAPQTVTTLQLTPDGARGSERAIGRQAGEFVVLTADLGDAAVSEWQWRIRNRNDGEILLEGTATIPPGGRLSLLIPVSRFGPGQYILAVRDSQQILPEITYGFKML